MEEELAPSSASRGRGVLPLPPRPGHNQPEPLPGGGDSRTKGIGFTAIPHHWAETAAQALFVGGVQSLSQSTKQSQRTLC